MADIVERQRFREALIERLNITGLTVAELARRSGVAKSQLDKLRQRKVDTTNVHDAVLIARFFGQSVEDFMGLRKRADRSDEVADLIQILPHNHKEIILAQVRAVIALRQQD